MLHGQLLVEGEGGGVHGPSPYTCRLILDFPLIFPHIPYVLYGLLILLEVDTLLLIWHAKLFKSTFILHMILYWAPRKPEASLVPLSYRFLDLRPNKS